MQPRVNNKRRSLIALTAAMTLLSGAFACAILWSSGESKPEVDRLAGILERGEMVMITRHGASSYFIDGEGPNGPEYVLARRFADRLGVNLKVKVADDYAELADALDSGKGDMIAANLSQTPQREQKFRFALPYDHTRTLVVVRKGLRKPDSVSDLEGLRGSVLADSSYAELLEQANTDLSRQAQSDSASPPLSWKAVQGQGVEDLLHAVAQGEYEYTLIDERVFRLHEEFYPDVREAFALGDTQPLAWAFERDDDDSLVQAADLFLREAQEDGTLMAIHDRYFAPTERLDQLDMMHFQRRMRERLPEYMPYFQQAANIHQLDWRLLVAMGYQESHWDPLAASPTGVRGVMMLTLNTAESLGVSDRLDPLQSIHGGAEYFLRMRERLPDDIAEPDRSWLALASYNIGMGHLEDARRLTEAQGGNPDRWIDVRERLPLLTQEKYHRNTRYGYARGFEAQAYVDNIQRFYETLIWMDTREHPLLAEQMIAAP